MLDKVKSEHLFIFPFSWKNQRKLSNALFHQPTQILSENHERLGHWKSYISTIESDKDYNEYVYFYKPIRMALYTFNGQPFIVRNYEYEGLTEDSYFELETDNRNYRLDIKKMELKLYKTRIGLLSFRMVNTRYEAIEDIEAINSFSTCVYPPALPIEKARGMGLPNCIRIHISDTLERQDDFKRDYCHQGLRISPLIMEVLGRSFTEKSAPYSEKLFLIEPILGSQMFCSCMYYNSKLVEEIYQEKMEVGALTRLMTFNKQSHALAELDKVAGKEESQYLKCEEHIYGINRYMLLCITKEKQHDKLYDQLAKLALMQRATLLNLSSELAHISTLPKSELSSAMASIYEIYIHFINQLYFKEVTEDSEGTYIYEQLAKVFKLEEELEQLNFEVDEVNEYANLVEQADSRLKVQFLTIIGAALVIPSFVTGFFGMNIFKEEALHWWNNRAVTLWLNSYVVMPILAVIALCLWSKKRSTIILLFKVILSVLFLVSLSFIFKYGCGF